MHWNNRIFRQNPVRKLASHWHRLVPLLGVLVFTSACTGNYALVEKQNIDFAKQYLEQQQQQQEAMLAQQLQFADILQKLDQRLAQPLSLKGPLVQMPAPAPVKPAIDQGTEKVVSFGKKQLVGEIEDVWFPELKLELESRIDTGATTSSLNVTNIEDFERDGSKWVRFWIGEEKGDAEDAVERKVVRRVRIIQSGNEDKESRPVIKLKVVLGSIEQTAEFTLTDRSHLEYEVLIGRNILRDVMVVDVSKKHAVSVDKTLGVSDE